MSERMRRVRDAQALHIRVEKVLLVLVVLNRLAVRVFDQVLAIEAL